MLVKDARKFADRKAAAGAADETSSLLGISTPEEAGHLGAILLGASTNALPKDIGKVIPAAQFFLNDNLSKFITGDQDAIKLALGALGGLLPPQLSQLMGKATPILSGGLARLLKDGGGLPSMDDLLDVDKLFSKDGLLNTDNLMGLASQFLPPWAGEAFSIGKMLDAKDFSGLLDTALEKFLPPELKAVYDAIKKLDGKWKKFLEDLTEYPKEKQGAEGFWAARLGDAVQCKAGVSLISSGEPSVLIGGQPAARAFDTVMCNLVPTADQIRDGEQTILIGGHFASRFYAGKKRKGQIGDKTMFHDAEIAMGFPTVHLGTHLGHCEICLTEAAEKGAATISGNGINPTGDGILDDIASGIGNMAQDKLTDLAKQKLGDAANRLLSPTTSPVPIKRPDSLESPIPQPQTAIDGNPTRPKRNRK